MVLITLLSSYAFYRSRSWKCSSTASRRSPRRVCTVTRAGSWPCAVRRSRWTSQQHWTNRNRWHSMFVFSRARLIATQTRPTRRNRGEWDHSRMAMPWKHFCTVTTRLMTKAVRAVVAEPERIILGIQVGRH